jgi:queuine tRNA-ribosyltransferase catalytic subunit
MHNVHHLLSLMRSARTAIVEDRYPDFVRSFFDRYFGDKGVPEWAVEALKGAGIDVGQ